MFTLSTPNAQRATQRNEGQELKKDRNVLFKYWFVMALMLLSAGTSKGQSACLSDEACNLVTNSGIECGLICNSSFPSAGQHFSHTSFNPNNNVSTGWSSSNMGTPDCILTNLPQPNACNNPPVAIQPHRRQIYKFDKRWKSNRRHC